MKRPIIKLGLIFLVIIFLIILGLHYYSLDGLDGWFFSRAFEQDTLYAPGYSDSAFRKIKIGMTQDEVLNFLGQPLDQWSINTDIVGQRWSKSPGDKSYRVRAVNFTKGKVTKKISEFYVD